jgi:N-acetylneuraminic acid mutarotase
MNKWFLITARLILCAVLLVAWTPWIAAISADEPTAVELMRRAHEGRAVWTVFPGFTADIVASHDGNVARGSLTVAADGKLSLKLDSTEGMEWAERTLSSVVSHRLSNDEAITIVEFAEAEAAHPLGRLIRSRDALEKSLWRVKDDVLTEVHRFHGTTRMIISVTDVTRNAEGKHLPRSFNVTTWNAETGAIESSRQVFNEWQRTGGYDLPLRLLAATSRGNGSRHVEEIVLSNHRVAEGKVKISELSPLSAPITSFGATVADGYLYVFGGHLGSPHKYSADQQANKLLRLNLGKPGEWETVAEGPRRTGLAMVAYRGKLYRIGGWEAKNAAGETWNLHSRRDFARFDPKAGQWEDLAPLPRGRSSHDAAVLGTRLYVVGGWELKGEGDGDWHDTAYVCDLAEQQPQWKEIAKPPFRRRALAVAAYDGKLYAIGGMDDSNEMTTAVNIYDPQSNVWSQGPAVPGRGFDGFGISAFGTNAGLFASSRSGIVCRLDTGRNAWVEIGKLNHARFFHRLLAVDEQRLVVVGGTSRGGKVPEVESLELRLAARQ